MRRTLLALVLLLTVGATYASAQVVFDADATAATVSTSVVGTTGVTNANLTVGAGSNRALVCQLLLESQGMTAVAVVWDATGTPQSLTQIGTFNLPGGEGALYLFGLVAPTSGNKTAKATWVGTSHVALNCLSYSGVDQTGGATTFYNFTTNQAIGTAVSVAVTSTSGDAVVDLMVSGSTSPSLSGTGFGTVTYSDNAVGPRVSGGSRAVGASTVTSSWTLSNSQQWGDVGASLKAAGGGGGGTVHPLMTMGVGGA